MTRPARLTSGVSAGGGCRLVKDTSNWSNKNETLDAERAACEQLGASLAELGEEGLAARVEQARQQQDEAQAALDK